MYLSKVMLLTSGQNSPLGTNHCQKGQQMGTVRLVSNTSLRVKDVCFVEPTMPLPR